MQEQKPFWQSKTLWGAVILLLSPLLRLSLEDQEQASSLLLNALEAVTQLVGFALAVYGRLTAKDKLTK